MAFKTTYTCRVRAFNASGNSGYSNTAQATTPSGIPLAPSNLTAKSGLKPQNRAYVNLRWRDNSADETGFVIERCRGTGCTNFTFLVQVVSDTTSAGVQGLQDGFAPVSWPPYQEIRT